MIIKIINLPVSFEVETIQDLARVINTFSYISEALSCGIVYSQDIENHLVLKSKNLGDKKVNVEFVKNHKENFYLHISGIYARKNRVDGCMKLSDNQLFVSDGKVLLDYAGKNH